MKIIGFNSYKGGACRTTTCYNTIPYLCKLLKATEKTPLLIVDLDLDSMGMTKLIANGEICKEDRFDNAYSSNSLFKKYHPTNNVFEDKTIGNVDEDEYFKCWVKAGALFGLEPGSVLFLGADSNAGVISDKEFEQLRESCPIGNLISSFKDAESQSESVPVGIVFDCAAGMQKSTQLLLQYVDTSIVCMRPTEQFRAGTLKYLKDSYAKLFSRRMHIGKREVILVPTSVPQIQSEKGSASYIKIADLRKKSFQYIDKMINIIKKVNDDKFYLNSTLVDCDNEDDIGIPEVERLKWQEDIPLIELKDHTEDETAALERYEKLAEEIAK